MVMMCVLCTLYLSTVLIQLEFMVSFRHRHHCLFRYWGVVWIFVEPQVHLGGRVGSRPKESIRSRAHLRIQFVHFSRFHLSFTFNVSGVMTASRGRGLNNRRKEIILPFFVRCQSNDSKTFSHCFTSQPAYKRFIPFHFSCILSAFNWMSDCCESLLRRMTMSDALNVHTRTQEQNQMHCCKWWNGEMWNANRRTTLPSHRTIAAVCQSRTTDYSTTAVCQSHVCCLLLATRTERALHLNGETFAPALSSRYIFTEFCLCSLNTCGHLCAVCHVWAHGGFAFRLYAAARSSIYPPMCVRMITHPHTHTHTEAQKTSLPLLFRLLFFPHLHTHPFSHRI